MLKAYIEYTKMVGGTPGHIHNQPKCSCKYKLKVNLAVSMQGYLRFVKGVKRWQGELKDTPDW
jgi:hypothetical protein